MNKEAEQILQSLRGSVEDLGVLPGIDSRIDMLKPEENTERRKVNYALIKKLPMGTHIKHEFSIGGVHFPLRILSIQEVMDCEQLINNKIAQYKHDSKMTLSTESLEMLRHYTSMIIILKRATTSCPEEADSQNAIAEDSGKQFFFLNENTLRALPITVIVKLFNEYQALEQRYNFTFDNLSEENIQFTIEELKKKPQAIFSLSVSQLQQIALFASQAHILPKDK